MINAAYRRVGPRRLKPMAQPVPLALRERTLLRLRDRASSIETILINGPELLAGLHRRIAELEERSR